MHNMRVRRYGDPNFTKLDRHHPEKCTYQNCNNKYMAKGFCYMHWRRWKTHGDPSTKLIRDSKTGTIIKSGYIMIKNKGKSTFLHRIIMEEKIGRKLTNNEVVHHIDCNPSNNSINNLEIISRGYHTKLHSILSTLLSINDQGLNHLNNHLKKYGLKLNIEKFSSSILVRNK